MKDIVAKENHAACVEIWTLKRSNSWRSTTKLLSKQPQQAAERSNTNKLLLKQYIRAAIDSSHPTRSLNCSNFLITAFASTVHFDTSAASKVKGSITASFFLARVMAAFASFSI